MQVAAKMFFLSFQHLVVIVVALVSNSNSDIHYVRPADSPVSSCPGQPCLTLHEYVEVDNFTNGTTLQFLPGNHTLQQLFRLVHISNVTLEPTFNHSVTNIICKDICTIQFEKVAHLYIIGLSFILSQRGDGSALEFSKCKSVSISGTVFQGSGDVTGRAMKITDSEVTLCSCMFAGTTFMTNRDHAGGGAIYSTGANLTIYESSFINNAANGHGGAIYAFKTNLLLNETIFHSNSAERSGGAISSINSQAVMVGANMFYNNSCRDSGGALSQELTNTYLSGRVFLLKNKAVRNGGALCISGLPVLNEFVLFTNYNHLTLTDNTAGNEGGAMWVYIGQVTLHGNVTIQRNTARIGGGIRADTSHILVRGDCSITRNNATYGGAVNTLYGTVYLQGPTQFTHNTADEDVGQYLLLAL